ncbi:MAG: ABC-F family ATP-binding cassette domain-containing protein [Candidatus Saccharimonadales bacterium]
MIANISVQEKSFGDKLLYADLSFQLKAHEKVGLIGRNGTGKTTLFNILTGADTDFAGKIEFQRNLIIISSRQDLYGYTDAKVLEYILDDLPDYSSLKHIIDTYPNTMGSNVGQLHKYSEALERFSTLGYFQVEEEISRSLMAYQLAPEQIDGTIGDLSGGQKRFVELVKVQHAKADLALIDEPTNHMDYLAKIVFTDWFKKSKESVLVITHDRDVLRLVDRIIEVRDSQALSFRGNYDDYLRSNATKIVSEVNEYSVMQRRTVNAKENVTRFKRLKERSRDPGTIARFKSLQSRAEKELSELQTHDKPSFWIDRESASNLNAKIGAAYEEHKARNIHMRTKDTNSTGNRLLIEAHKLSLGYNATPLFSNVSFQLREGERIRFHGRNGAGKSTLVKTIMAKTKNTVTSSKLLGGTLAVEPEINIGIYEQEIPESLLDLSLAVAIDKACRDNGIILSDQKIKQYLSEYLFDPVSDGDVKMSRLSGGQKARFQLIKMLANDPQVLILDEPTNHLDLPSIEELENALANYNGAVIYISHDSYFVKNIGGETIPIGDIAELH